MSWMRSEKKKEDQSVITHLKSACEGLKFVLERLKWKTFFYDTRDHNVEDKWEAFPEFR